jgi:hypothetical protein
MIYLTLHFTEKTAAVQYTVGDLCTRHIQFIHYCTCIHIQYIFIHTHIHPPRANKKRRQRIFAETSAIENQWLSSWKHAKWSDGKCEIQDIVELQRAVKTE